MIKSRFLEFRTSIIVPTSISQFIFLNLTSYFGGIRPIVVSVDKICRQDKNIEVSRNLLVMAPSISYLFHIWIYFSIRFFTMIPNKFKFTTPSSFTKGREIFGPIYSSFIYGKNQTFKNFYILLSMFPVCEGDFLGHEG